MSPPNGEYTEEQLRRRLYDIQNNPHEKDNSNGEYTEEQRTRRFDIQNNPHEKDNSNGQNIKKKRVNPEVFSTYEGTFIYNPLTKIVTQTDTQDIDTPLRYLSHYYPPSFRNMATYMIKKFPLGGTKRKRKRTKRRFTRWNSFKN